MVLTFIVTCKRKTARRHGGDVKDMTPQLWIGFGFLTALVIFLIVSFFVTPRLTDDQRKTMKFLTALCAGVSGGFLSGASVFDATWTTPTTKIALSGTAGFALFFVVLIFYNRVFIPDDAVEFEIPANSTFRQAADIAAQLGGVLIDYQALNANELATPMVPGHISCKTFRDLFKILRLKTKIAGSVRDYRVTNSGNIYRFAPK
jgi:hypothetical protein